MKTETVFWNKFRSDDTSRLCQKNNKNSTKKVSIG